jgi:hypothetical protein
MLYSLSIVARQMRSPVARKKLFHTKKIPAAKQRRKAEEAVVQLSEEDRVFADKGIYI